MVKYTTVAGTAITLQDKQSPSMGELHGFLYTTRQGPLNHLFLSLGDTHLACFSVKIDLEGKFR
jgi:hypothetical protein